MILKWIPSESLLHMVTSVQKQVSIRVQIYNLQTQGVEITLIQCYFNAATLKQRWINVISIPCIRRNWENIHNGARGCNLSKVTFENVFSLHLI